MRAWEQGRVWKNSIHPLFLGIMSRRRGIPHLILTRNSLIIPSTLKGKAISICCAFAFARQQQRFVFSRKYKRTLSRSNRQRGDSKGSSSSDPNVCSTWNIYIYMYIWWKCETCLKVFISTGNFPAFSYVVRYYHHHYSDESWKMLFPIILIPSALLLYRCTYFITRLISYTTPVGIVVFH